VAEKEAGVKILRGILIAVLIVAAIVLLAAYWRQAGHAGGGVGHFISSHVPSTTGQRSALAVYLVLAVLLAILFSKAGHFTAYGVAVGLAPLLWVLFWEGFPLLGLHSTWVASMGLAHLSPGLVALWAFLADVLITIVFVPLELREKARRRAHQLGEKED
jgi:hypothetical protein